MKIEWTIRARNDLFAIAEVIAAENPGAALRLFERLRKRVMPLARHPRLGRKLEELPDSGLRELVEGNYLVVYEVESDTVRIIQLFHGKRDSSRELDL